MGNAKAGGWRYTARYGWNWRSARAISGALSAFALPTPPWFRAVVARCLLTRTALQADAEGIWGSAGPRPAGPGGRCPCAWKDITDVVVWDYHHLRIIGLARRGDTIGGGPAVAVGALALVARSDERRPCAAVGAGPGTRRRGSGPAARTRKALRSGTCAGAAWPPGRCAGSAVPLEGN